MTDQVKTQAKDTDQMQGGPSLSHMVCVIRGNMTLGEIRQAMAPAIPKRDGKHEPESQHILVLRVDYDTDTESFSRGNGRKVKIRNFEGTDRTICLISRQLYENVKDAELSLTTRAKGKTISRRVKLNIKPFELSPELRPQKNEYHHWYMPLPSQDRPMTCDLTTDLIEVQITDFLEKLTKYGLLPVGAYRVDIPLANREGQQKNHQNRLFIWWNDDLDLDKYGETFIWAKQVIHNTLWYKLGDKSQKVFLRTEAWEHHDKLQAKVDRGRASDDDLRDLQWYERGLNRGFGFINCLWSRVDSQGQYKVPYVPHHHQQAHRGGHGTYKKQHISYRDRQQQGYDNQNFRGSSRGSGGSQGFSSGSSRGTRGGRGSRGGRGGRGFSRGRGQGSMNGGRRNYPLPTGYQPRSGPAGQEDGSEVSDPTALVGASVSPKSAARPKYSTHNSGTKGVVVAPPLEPITVQADIQKTMTFAPAPELIQPKPRA